MSVREKKETAQSLLVAATARLSYIWVRVYIHRKIYGARSSHSFFPSIYLSYNLTTIRSPSGASIVYGMIKTTICSVRPGPTTCGKRPLLSHCTCKEGVEVKKWVSGWFFANVKVNKSCSWWDYVWDGNLRVNGTILFVLHQCRLLTVPLSSCCGFIGCYPISKTRAGLNSPQGRVFAI